MTTHRETGHLLRRAGFGPRPADFAAFAPLTWQDAVDRLIDYAAVPDRLPADPTPTRHVPDSDELRLSPLDVMTWWLDRMVRSERPLEEKLTLFWHDHFATSIAKAPPALMLVQNRTLRRLALGNFRDLLLAVTTDPAMLLYLDGHTNAAGNPNENHARELFELHTLGQGAYTETDIKEAARALTGWVVRGRRHDAAVAARFVPRRHDGGTKRIFGRQGAWRVADVVDLILEQPTLPAFITGKLARFLVRDDLDEEFLDALATRFATRNFELRPDRDDLRQRPVPLAGE